MFKKADLMIYLVILAAVILSAFAVYSNPDEGSRIKIYADGRLYGIFDLSEKTVIELPDGHNKIEIDGGARMIYADCPGGDCVKQGFISKAGQCIICTPNKVVVEITGKSEVDAVAK